MYHYNYENPRILCENYENHETHIIYLRIMKIIEFHKIIKTIVFFFRILREKNENH